MKTTKEQTENFARFLLKSRVTGRVYLDRVRIAHLLDIIDDIDELEDMLKMKQDDWLEVCEEVDKLEDIIKWQAEMLERAKTIASDAIRMHERPGGGGYFLGFTFLKDLEKGK